MGGYFADASGTEKDDARGENPFDDVESIGRERMGHLPLSATPNGDQTRGEWFVSRDNPHAGDYDGTRLYLHRDGVWRTSTFSTRDGFHRDMPTGYFESEDDAKAALAKARGETAK